MAVLRSTHASRSGVQGSQRRSVLAPDLSPVGAASGGAHFCVVPGVLPARAFACVSQTLGAWIDASFCVGKDRGRANAGRAFPPQRRRGPCVLPLHAARERSEDAPGAAGLGTAAPIATAHHSERAVDPRVTLVQTFWNRPPDCRHLRAQPPASSESRVRVLLPSS